MEIRFDCECYERTLVITFPKGYVYLKNELLELLEQYYNEWLWIDGPYGEEIQDMCLEEYMMDRLSEIYNMWTEWCVEGD